MKIEITCDCGEKTEITSLSYISDTTPCICGQCHGESYEICFGTCPKCKKALIMEHAY